VNALALEDKRQLAAPNARPRRLFDPGEVTLEELLEAVDESLATTGSAHCPLCGDRLERAGAEGVSRCSGCGSTLD
jgi:tRNA(Ile2) C34 agmatinyltransferase TiaS